MRIKRWCFLLLFVTHGVWGNDFKEYDTWNKTLLVKSEAPIYIGSALGVISHIEDGLDKSKGEYSARYTTVGGNFSVEYHWLPFIFEGVLGLQKLVQLSVNSFSIDMAERTQWHIMFSLNSYYKVASSFALGVGLTNLTETPMYVHGVEVPESSFLHLFLDVAARYTPSITENLFLNVTGILGLNLLPGRRVTYSPFTLLHTRFQINLGVLYRVR